MRRQRVAALLVCAALSACRTEEKPASQAPSPAPATVPASPNPDLGIKIVKAGDNPARAPGPKGIMVDMGMTEVRVLLLNPAGAAAEAGFAPGDVILAADGKDVDSEEALQRILQDAAGRELVYEVRHGEELLTLRMATRDPGWLVLSGDTFRGFLISRLQQKSMDAELPPGKHAPELELPGFDHDVFRLSALRERPAALIFFGTFSEPCYAHLQELSKVCRARPELACAAVDTMEIFTAVGKTAAFAKELLRVRKEMWPELPLGVDLFSEGERRFGVRRLPAILLLRAGGQVAERFDGPLADPPAQLRGAVARLLEEKN
ncbi:MAG: PDZ domain-containing protein [Myxococcales bacterium]|nr:PDZ domain-containing protein [Myxococcales bacterium]